MEMIDGFPQMRYPRVNAEWKSCGESVDAMYTSDIPSQYGLNYFACHVLVRYLHIFLSPSLGSRMAGLKMVKGRLLYRIMSFCCSMVPSSHWNAGQKLILVARRFVCMVMMQECWEEFRRQSLTWMRLE
jgi:hypothetical protein